MISKYNEMGEREGVSERGKRREKPRHKVTGSVFGAVVPSEAVMEGEQWG